MGFSRRGYWSGWLVSSSGDIPNPGIELRSPALQANSLQSETLRKPEVFKTPSQSNDNLRRASHRMASPKFSLNTVLLSLPADQAQAAACVTRPWSLEEPSAPVCRCCSVAKSCPMLRTHGLQHARLPCPSLSVMPSNHLILCLPLLLLPSSFPASGSFPMSRRFTSGGQSIGASASAPGLPMNIQG